MTEFASYLDLLHPLVSFLETLTNIGRLSTVRDEYQSHRQGPLAPYFQEVAMVTAQM